MTSYFPPIESLVSDIPAGDGNIEQLFYGVVQHFQAFLPGLNFFFQQKNLEQSWQHCLRDLQREWKTEEMKSKTKENLSYIALGPLPRQC
jgi:hypothetical protein